MTSRQLKHWTTDEDQQLRLIWDTGFSLATIARRLGRTEVAIGLRAEKLGLTAGRPSDAESLWAASKRTGFEIRQLKAILAAANVRLRARRNPRRARTAGKFHQFFVDPLDLDDAIAAWLQTEPTAVAARRHGVSPRQLRAALREKGLIRAAGSNHPIRVTEAQVRQALEIRS